MLAMDLAENGTEVAALWHHIPVFILFFDCPQVSSITLGHEQSGSKNTAPKTRKRTLSPSYPPTAYPSSLPRSFLKDLEKYECFRFRIGAAHGPATELCRLVVRAAVTLLVVAALLALPCAIAAA